MNERFPPPAAGTVVRKPVPPGRPVSDTEVDKEPKKRGQVRSLIHIFNFTQYCHPSIYHSLPKELYTQEVSVQIQEYQIAINNRVKCVTNTTYALIVIEYLKRRCSHDQKSHGPESSLLKYPTSSISNTDVFIFE